MPLKWDERTGRRDTSECEERAEGFGCPYPMCHQRGDKGCNFLAREDRDNALSPVMRLDPGTAPPEVVADLISDLSIMYRRMGGSGIEWSTEPKNGE